LVASRRVVKQAASERAIHSAVASERLASVVIDDSPVGSGLRSSNRNRGTNR
jgi:hypothetical protein